jgi:hypothetical protein
MKCNPLITAALVATLFLLSACIPACQPDDEFTSGDLVLILEVAGAGAELGQHLARSEGDFDGCMVTCGVGTALEAATQYAPEIEAEVKQPDGHLAFPEWAFDGTACAEDLAGNSILPEPWPPLAPPPDIGAVLQPVLDVSLDWTADKVEDSAPTEGESCIRAHVGAAVIRSLSAQLGAVMDDLFVEADLKMPIAGFDADYSGCGLVPSSP